MLDGGITVGIGHGVAMAVGAYLAKPGRQVLSVMGDGGMRLDGMNVEAAVRCQTLVVYLVNNNHEYMTGMGALYRHVVKTPGIQSPVSPWATVPTYFSLVGKAFGAYSERVEDPDKLAGAVERALTSGKASVIDVVEDPNAGGFYDYHENTVKHPFMSWLEPEDLDDEYRAKIFPHGKTHVASSDIIVNPAKGGAA